MEQRYLKRIADNVLNAALEFPACGTKYHKYFFAIKQHGEYLLKKYILNFVKIIIGFIIISMDDDRMRMERCLEQS